MKGSDIFLALFILLIFLALYFFNVFVVEFANIQNNWPEYRCNPMVMPFAGNFGVDPTENFTYCIQNMQTGFMGYLLEPVNYSLQLFNSLGGEFTTAIDMIRNVFDTIRDFISNIIQSVFGVFLNILIQFQKIAISMKDMVAKTIGIITTMLYFTDGTIKTMESAWGSPAGDVMRALCFHPDTMITLKNGKRKKMRNLDLGDMLQNNAMVCATMQIKNFVGSNKDNPKEFLNTDTNFEQIEQLYTMKNEKSPGSVYVTGTHLVQHNGEWIEVSKHPKAEISNKRTKWLSCVITSNHLVPIGDYIFHDWEDDNGSPSKDLSDGFRAGTYR